MTYQEKLNILKSVSHWPSNVKLINNPNIKNPLEAIRDLVKKGYKKIVMVCGSDRKAEYERYEKYAHEYGATSYGVITLGTRDPDSDDQISSISGTAMRQAVQNNDFKFFEKMFISKNKQIAKETFEKLRKRL